MCPIEFRSYCDSKAMNVFFEDDGGFKVASVMSDTGGALQVESTSGKRSKIKAANVLLRFESALAALWRLRMLSLKA
jgi:hypothetical protein